MGRMLVLILGFGLFCFCCSAYSAEQISTGGDEETITWYRADFPPSTILRGIDAGAGFGDKINAFVISKMPDYNHLFVEAGPQRIEYALEKKDLVCCATLYKTKEREKYTKFSVPALVVLPNGLIIKKADKKRFDPYLNEEKKIVLDQLLKEKQVSIGIATGRKYSGNLDEMLAEYSESPALLKRSGVDVFQGLLEMLLLGRVDGIIGYPVEARYLSRKSNREDEILFLPIAETTDSYTLGYFGCPDTPWGNRVIRRVDEVLLKYRDTPEVLGFYAEWLDGLTVESYQDISRRALQSTP